MSLCVKLTFLDPGCSGKAKIAFENCNLVFFIMIAMSQCHDLSWSCMIMQENGSCDNAISFLKLKMLRITELHTYIRRKSRLPRTDSKGVGNLLDSYS